MNSQITSGDVAAQFAKAIQMLLDWVRQEMHVSSQAKTLKAGETQETGGNSNSLRPKNLLNATEIGKALNVSRAQAYKLMQSGEIPAIRIGRAVRVKQSDLEEFIKKNRDERSTKLF